MIVLVGRDEAIFSGGIRQPALQIARSGDSPGSLQLERISARRTWLRFEFDHPNPSIDELRVLPGIDVLPRLSIQMALTPSR